MLRWVFFASVAGLLPSSLNGQNAAVLDAIVPRHYVAYRSAGEMTIDGKLDEPSWQRAEWTSPFVDIEGDHKPSPWLLTRAKMLWDDTYFYVAADLEEPHVWASLGDRDAAVYHDNDFEVYIDPDGDTHEYYEFEVNAGGAVGDLFVLRPDRDGGLYLGGWDIAGLEAAVRVWGSLNEPRDADEGWSVEVAFPWEALEECARRPTPPRDGDHWRVNLARVEWETEVDQGVYAKVEGQSASHWTWSAQGLVNMHCPEMWGFVQFAREPVGRARVPIQLPREEEAKKVLRQIYYAQRRFRDENGHYTASLESLGVEHRILNDFLWPPQLQATDRLFEAAIEEVVDLHQDGGLDRWHIRQDSKTWKE